MNESVPHDAVADDVVVVIGSDDRWVVPAALFAGSLDRALVRIRDWGALPDWVASSRLRSLILVFPSEELNSTDVQCLSGIVSGLARFGGPDSPTIGCLTGRDLSSVSWLVAKCISDYPDNGGALMLFPTRADDNYGQPGAELCVLNGEACVNVGIPALQGQDRLPYRVVAVEEHGRSDHVGIRDGIICGDVLSYFGRNSGPGGMVPQCAYGLGCFKSGPLVPVMGIQARYLFLHTCTSGHLAESIYDPPFLLSHAGVDGLAAGYVGTLRAKANGKWECTLFVQALRAGLTLGQAVGLLNRMQREVDRDTPCFLLLGDPLARPYPRSEGSAEVMRVEDGSTVVRLRTGRAPLVSVALDLPGPNGRPVYVTLPDGANTPGMHGWVDIAGSRPMLYLWRYSVPLPETFECAIRTNPPLDSSLPERWEAAQHHYSINRRYGLIPPALEGSMQKTRELARNVGLHLKRSRFTPDAYRECKKASGHLEDLLASIDRKLLRLLVGTHDRPWPFADNLEAHFTYAASREAGQCCWCGRPLLQNQIRPLLEPGTERFLYTCLRCGDIALTSADGLDVWWDGDSVGVVGGKLHHRLRLTNSTDRVTSGCAGLLFSRVYGGRVKFLPEIRSFQLAPGEQVDLGFTMSVEDAAPHVYVVQAYIVHQLQIEYFRRFVQVLPAAQITAAQIAADPTSFSNAEIR